MSDDDRELRVEDIRAVRLGHGANCSSIGSVIDTLFVSAAVGGALLAAILAAMKTEPVRISPVAAPDPSSPPPPPDPPAS